MEISGISIVRLKEKIMLARFIYIALAVITGIASSYFSGRASEVDPSRKED